MAKADYSIPKDATLREAARVVLESAFCKMLDNEEGTQTGLKSSEPTEVGIEALHDMRVGTRRLRAALAVFGKVFPKDEFQWLDKAVGRITDALGAVRDLDVQLDSLRRLQAQVPENEAYGIGRLIARQTKLRDKERKILLAEMDRLKKEKFDRRFRTDLERHTLPPAIEGPSEEVKPGDDSGKAKAGKGTKPEKEAKAEEVSNAEEVEAKING